LACKKKRTITYRFDDVLGNNVDIFDSWIASGFYDLHLKALYELYPQQNVKVCIFEDIKKDPILFLKDIFVFLEVGQDFVPPVTYKKINVATFKPTMKDIILNLLLLRQPQSSEYNRGVSLKLRKELLEIYSPHIDELEKLLQRDLSNWRE
jgi:hypothetical protein